MAVVQTHLNAAEAHSGKKSEEYLGKGVGYHFKKKSLTAQLTSMSGFAAELPDLLSAEFTCSLRIFLITAL